MPGGTVSYHKKILILDWIHVNTGAVLRIRDVYPGSRIRLFFYSGSELSPSRIRIEEFLSSRKYDPGCSSRIRMLTFYPSRIQGSKRHRIPDQDPQHCTGVGMCLFFMPYLTSSIYGTVPYCSFTNRLLWFHVKKNYSRVSVSVFHYSILRLMAFKREQDNASLPSELSLLD